MQRINNILVKKAQKQAEEKAAVEQIERPVYQPPRGYSAINDERDDDEDDDEESDEVEAVNAAVRASNGYATAAFHDLTSSSAPASQPIARSPQDANNAEFIENLSPPADSDHHSNVNSNMSLEIEDGGSAGNHSFDDHASGGFVSD